MKDISLEEDSKEKWKKGMKKANESRSEKSKQELENAFNFCSEDGKTADLDEVASYLEINKKSLYNKVKKHDGFEVVDGLIIKK